MVQTFKRIISFLLTPYTRWKQKRDFQRQVEEMRKRDPFIYK